MKKYLGLFLVIITLVLCIPSSVRAEETSEEPVESEISKESLLNENGNFEIRASEPKNEADFLFRLIIKLIDEENLDLSEFDIPSYSEDFKKLKLTINYGKENAETFEVDIEYVYDELVEQEINKLLSDLINKKPSNEETNEPAEIIRITDLEMIHHYYYSNRYKTIERQNLRLSFIDSFVSKLKADINNTNVNFRMMVIPYEEGNDLKGETFAVIGWYAYEDIIYLLHEEAIEFDLSHIFYVPTDTEDDAEVIKNVAQKRINAYLKNENVTIDYVSEDIITIGDYLQEEIDLENENITDYLETNYNLSEVNKDDYIYKVKMEIDENLTKEFYIVIKRNSDKMINSFQSVDLMTGIEVNTNTPITLDTLISASKVTDGDEYDRIIRLLDLTDSVTYDIKLFSKIENKYITKLEDGTFEVKIPIPEELQGKDLTAYYVDKNGKIEEYEVTIKDGYAVFKTTHFSIYTLGYAEKNDTTDKDTTVPKEENPNTYDGIGSTVLVLTVALIGLASTFVIFKRKRS